MDAQKFTIRETIISTLINTAIVFGITLAQAKGGFATPPFETFDIAIKSMAPDIIIPLLFYTIIGTMITRRAIAAGKVPQQSSKFRYYPVIVRGFINAIVISIIVVPVTALLFSILFNTVTSGISIILIKCINVAVLGVIFAPINIQIEMNTNRKLA